MPYFVTGFLLLACAIFWGAGLALLATPHRYRRFALIFAPVAGLSLQSLVVWVGAYANLKGTDSYGRIALVIPAILLIVAWWRGKRRGSRFKPAMFPGLCALMVVQLMVMVLPFALSERELTTVSVGSLDAADYGAGARVLQEFAHSDRSGFLGLKEVVSVGVVDNFYDFWLRTNHFTPSALIALNGSLFGLKPHQLTSLVTIVLFVATLPMVFWLARAGLRYRPWPSFAITAIYAVNPINWYAVYNVATAQILAANAIALLTWCGVSLWRQGAGWRRGWGWAGLLAIAYGLIFGSYNFIIVVCLAPAVAYAGGLAWWRGRWTQSGRWLVLMLAPLFAAGLIYLERSLGVLERLVLFRSRFGWEVPLLTPEGWLGMVDGAWLTAYSAGWRVPMAVIAAALIAAALIEGGRRRRPAAYVALCLTVPILIGYGIILVRGHDVFATYEAYKLFAVFYPGMLAGFCYWIDRWPGGGLRRRWPVVAAVVVLLALNLFGEWRLFYRLRSPVAVVDKKLVALGGIEKLPAVSSINLRLSDGWARLWASTFLLKTPHYFEIHTYEGRRSTPLWGEWDLLGNFFSFDLPDPADSLHPVHDYTLLRRASSSFVEADFGAGWGEEIRDDPRPSPRTRWAQGDTAVLILRNPGPVPMILNLRAAVRSVNARKCDVLVGGEICAQLALTREPQIWEQLRVLIPPGETLIEFRTDTPPDLVGGRVRRPVTIAVDGLDIRVLALTEKTPTVQ